ncbi:hypothetical protein AAKU64_004336 [Undibacterium sp. GrIS 1.8]
MRRYTDQLGLVYMGGFPGPVVVDITIRVNNKQSAIANHGLGNSILQGVVLISVQYATVGAPSIHAGYRVIGL